MTKKEEKITKEKAREIAGKMLYEYMTADWGKRLVSDNEHPLKAYIQDQNSWSQAGEVFSVQCPGLSNLEMYSRYRDGWECDHLSDEEVIADCCENGDMSPEIEDLAEKIYESSKN